MSARTATRRKFSLSATEPTGLIPGPNRRTLEILSNAVDRLEGAARVAHVLSNWAQDGTKLAAFHELAQQLPAEVMVLKAVRDELITYDREGTANA